jgi:hypothetical protein
MVGTASKVLRSAVPEKHPDCRGLGAHSAAEEQEEVTIRFLGGNFCYL